MKPRVQCRVHKRSSDQHQELKTLILLWERWKWGWGKVHNEELHNLNLLAITIRVAKARIMAKGYIASM